MRLAALILAMLIPMATVNAADPAPITLTTRVAFMTEPGYLRLTQQIEPDARNISWCLIVDAESYYSSSCREIEDGANERRTTYHDLKDLPAGEYVATAAVCRNSTCSDRSVASVQFRVIESLPRSR